MGSSGLKVPDALILQVEVAAGLAVFPALSVQLAICAA